VERLTTSVLLRPEVGCEMLFGGGDILCIDLLRDNSTCAFLECDNARSGTTGASRDGAVADVRVAVVDLFVVTEKKSFTSFSIEVNGVIGDESRDELSADFAGV